MNLVKTTQTNIVHLIKYVDDGRNQLSFVADRKKSAFRPNRNWITADTMRPMKKSAQSAAKPVTKAQNLDLKLHEVSQPEFKHTFTRITDNSHLQDQWTPRNGNK